MKPVLIILFILSFAIASAQDQVFKKDNTKIEAKVIEVGISTITYKPFNDQDGPPVTIPTSELSLIIYQNGSHQVFNEQPKQARDTLTAQDKNKMKFKKVTARRQVVFLDLLEIFNGNAGISYLCEFAHNRLNVYIPVSTGFTAPAITNSAHIHSPYMPNDYILHYAYSRKVIDAAMGINFQTNVGRPATHFIGLLAGGSQFNGNVKSFDYNLSHTSSYTFVQDNFYVMINNGILFRPGKHLNVMAYLAVGYQGQFYLTKMPFYIEGASNNPFGRISLKNYTKLGLNIGYRF